MGRGVLAFHPRLVGLTGGVTSALMLSQSLYWTRIMAERQAQSDGWFWKTRGDWRSEIGISRHEQDSARRRLTEAGFWQERRIGMPARMWYRVDLDALARTIDNDFSGRWDWRDEQALAHLLGRPLLVYRALADLCQSVTVSVLMSRLLHEERIALRSGAQPQASGWYRYDLNAILRHTGLTRAEFYHARKQMREAGFISERRIGIPPRSEYRLNLELIASALERDAARTKVASQLIHKAPPVPQMSLDLGGKPSNEPETRAVAQLAGFRTFSLLENHILECGKPANMNVVKPHTGDLDSGQLEIRNPANKMAEIKTHSGPNSGQPIEKMLTTGKPITNPLPPTPVADALRVALPIAGGGGVNDESSENLIWPPMLLEAERPVAARLLTAIPHMAQTVLDELAGQAAQSLIRQPLAYLRRLVEQCRQDLFVPMVAARIADGRVRAEALRRQRAAVGLAESSVPDKPQFELSAVQRAARRHDLEEMKRKLSLASICVGRPRTTS